METLLFRETVFERKAVDAKRRTATIAFSSEEPVDRGSYREILGHSQGEYDFARLNNGAPLLLNHDPDQQIGVVESARVDNDGRRKVGRAVVRFGKGQLADEIFQDVADGIRRHVSVGYQQTEELERPKGGEKDNTIRFKWKPYELTLATIPADETVGVGRTAITKENREMKTENNNDRTEIIELVKVMVHDHPHLDQPAKDLAARAHCEGWKYDKFREELWKVAQAAPKLAERGVPVEIGMGRGDIEGYSFTRLIRGLIEGKGVLKPSPELDFSQQVAASSNMQPEGVFIPLEVTLGCSAREYRQREQMRRDMTVGNFSTGGAFVPMDIMAPIDLLRNRTVCIRLGAQVMAGLTANCAFPRQTSPTTMYSLPEVGLCQTSDPTIDQVTLVPHRVSARVKYGRQLMFQAANTDVEGFVRRDISKQLGIKHDWLAIFGGGNADEPVGIVNTPGIGSVTFGGPTTWQEVIGMETALGVQNADQGRMAYVVPPLVRAKWKALGKALTGVSVVGSVPVWENGPMPNEELVAGVVNSYPAVSTNQLAGTNQVLFVNMSDLLIAYFGGLDMIFDPYTSAGTAENVLTVNTWIDTALLHPASACYSTDSGAL